MIKKLRRQKYFLLAISNSPKAVVDEFTKNFKFNKAYGRIYAVDKAGRLTGEGIYFGLMDNKALILKRALEKENLTLSGSIGVGDTEADIPFLKMVERPIQLF